MTKKSLVEDLVSKKILVSGDNRLRLFNKVDISMYGARSWTFTIEEIGKKRERNMSMSVVI